MDQSRLLRAARRHVGCDQRSFAAELGVPAGTLASWESGRRVPSVAALDRALAVAGLDLVLVRGADRDGDVELLRHLHLSLTQRLRIALGESHVLSTPARSELWQELGRLARRGQVVLAPPLAHALWLPIGRVLRPAVTVFHAKTALSATHVDTRVRDGDAPRAAIPLMMEIGERVWVLPPGELALPSETETRLRFADELLHARAALDDAARRRPAHRDPDESGEDWRLLRTKSAVHRPDMRDGRGWRLRASASLAQRMRDEMTG